MADESPPDVLATPFNDVGLPRLDRETWKLTEDVDFTMLEEVTADQLHTDGLDPENL